MVKKKKIAIVCDHAGFFIKEKLVAFLKDKYEIKDFGTFSKDTVDYPDLGHKIMLERRNKQACKGTQ
jgi:ribose 5-phosphate isomerase RpiB